MDNKNYGEIICQAVDTIVAERLAGLSYDQTVLCTVVNDSKRDQGIYTVSNGSTKFEAYSTSDEYRNNNNVYVLIPKGDWNETKIITGKKTIKEQEISYNYRNPFDYLVDITGNMISAPLDKNIGLVANDRNKDSITLWSYNFANSGAIISENGEPLSGYTRLGIQAQFQSWLNPFYIETTNEETEEKITLETKIIQGSYGLRLKITVLGDKTVEDSEKSKEYYLYLDSSDMNGNPYDFATYFQQEKVFDISSFEQITALELEFYQRPGTFTDGENEIPYLDFLDNIILPNLFVKDPMICLGYDARDFENDEAIVYSLDNTTFTSAASDEKNKKIVQLRWIHDFGNNFLRTVKPSDKEDLNYEIRWYRYKFGSASADEYSGVYWKRIEPIEGNEFRYEFVPDIVVAEEKIKVIIFYNDLVVRSNIFVFTNEKEVVNQATVDAVSAVGIECEDKTYGNYRIYTLGNSLLNQADSSINRTFRAWFNKSILAEAEKIEWIIPKKRSMIVIKPEFIEAYGGYDEGDEDNYRIVRNIAQDPNSGEYQVGNANGQQYNIRSYYSQSYSNNTITCIITKDRVQYIGNKELTFGPAGTTGTDCTFVLDFDNGVIALTQGSGDAITVTARLYDYENKEVDLSKYTIEWTIKNQEGMSLRRTENNENYKREIVLSSSLNIMQSNYNILQATLTDFGDFDLVAYLPLPIRSNTSYKYIAGTTSLVYNSQGYLDDFYQNPYIVYYSQNENDLEEIYGEWHIETTEESNYAPKLSPFTDKNLNKTTYKLVPTSIYVENTNTQVCVYCTNDKNEVIWSQPLLIIQNRYPAKMINDWDGKLQLGGDDGNSILSARVIAGKKESDNSFSGVMMGDWSGKDVETYITNNTGIYGFKHGSASFGFRDNGTAFIGQSVEGRIEFDGEKGIIESGNYESNGTAGMSINLKEGTINAHQFELNVGGSRNTINTIFISTDKNKYPLQIGRRFYVDWDGTINATDGKFTGEINATSGKLGNLDVVGTLNVSGIIKGGRIEGSSISAGTITGSVISGNATAGGSLKFGDNFSVSSSGFLKATGAEISGKITAEAGEIGGWTIDGATLKSTSGSVILNGGSGIIKADKITVYNGSNDIGYLGYFMGNNGSNVVGIKSYSNYSTVLESSQSIRLSASSSINLNPGADIVCSGKKFSIHGMNSLSLPKTVTDSNNETLFTVGNDSIAFSCTTTGIYATLK